MLSMLGRLAVLQGHFRSAGPGRGISGETQRHFRSSDKAKNNHRARTPHRSIY